MTDAQRLRAGPAPLLGVLFGLLLSLTGWWGGAALADKSQAETHEAEASRTKSDPHLQRMLDRREDGAPAPLPAGGLPTFEAPAASSEGGAGSPVGVIAFLLVLTATLAVASTIDGPGRRTFVLLSMLLATPGVALGALTFALGTLFTRGPA